MLFLTSEQIRALARLPRSESTTLETSPMVAGAVCAVAWGKDGRPREFTITAEGKVKRGRSTL